MLIMVVISYEVKCCHANWVNTFCLSLLECVIYSGNSYMHHDYSLLSTL